MTSPAGALADFDDALAEETLDADDQLVARLEQIDQARFHAGHAGGADGEGQEVLGLKRLPQHVLDFVHQHQKLRIEMPHERRGHRGQDARMHVAGTRTKQQTRRRIQLTG